MDSKLAGIIEAIEAMPVLELKKLNDLLEQDLGVSSVATMVVPDGTAVAVGLDTKTSFDIVCESVPIDKKISAIKVVREILSIGLKEAKDFVDGLPKTIASDLDKDQAASMRDKLRAADVVVTIK